ncbi:hypothetical protein H9P43_007707 [Blastocladiella emersonii ATCC 22665]|nr:hypothetical protein H9P43_007707 [Blastocladiella emersonii ATCC 22665]
MAHSLSGPLLKEFLSYSDGGKLEFDRIRDCKRAVVAAAKAETFATLAWCEQIGHFSPDRHVFGLILHQLPAATLAWLHAECPDWLATQPWELHLQYAAETFATLAWCKQIGHFSPDRHVFGLILHQLPAATLEWFRAECPEWPQPLHSPVATTTTPPMPTKS